MRTLVKAFRLARKEKDQLIILGDGPERSELAELADESIKLLGEVNNVSEYLGAADLFVSTSFSEGLPNTVLEAMSCGLPCLLSDIPAHRELFEETSNIFFTCGDVDDLAERFAAFDSAIGADLGRYSRRLVEERFSAKVMSKGYQLLYKRIKDSAN
jgi:glycosyltransferase involved in cell wall biosynthesis